MIILGRNQFNHSFIIKYFKTLYLQEYTKISHFLYLGKFQMLIARQKAHGPIHFRSFMFLLDLGENK